MSPQINFTPRRVERHFRNMPIFRQPQSPMLRLPNGRIISQVQRQHHPSKLNNMGQRPLRYAPQTSRNTIQPFSIRPVKTPAPERGVPHKKALLPKPNPFGGWLNFGINPMPQMAQKRKRTLFGRTANLLRTAALIQRFR